MPKASN